MTIEEVSEKYNVSISSLKNNFKRTQERINKKYSLPFDNNPLPLNDE